MVKPMAVVWDDLPSDVRHTLIVDPYQVLSADAVVAVTKHGSAVLNAYWVASGEPDTGFRLVLGAAEWIELTKSKVDGLLAEAGDPDRIVADYPNGGNYRKFIAQFGARLPLGAGSIEGRQAAPILFVQDYFAHRKSTVTD